MSKLSNFRYQPQETPLSPEVQQTLGQLLRSSKARQSVQTRLDNAAKTLTETAGQLNDRGSEQKFNHEKKTRRLQQNGDEIDPEEQDDYEKFQTKASDLTKRLDQSIRGVIDSRVWLEEAPEALLRANAKAKEVSRNAEESERQTRRRAEAADDEDVVEQEPIDDPSFQLDPSDAPSVVFGDIMSINATTRSLQTPTDRYAKDNTYIGFYRTVFDAKNPGDGAPLVPQSSLWFAEEEGRVRDKVSDTQGQHGGSEGEDGDSDLEVAAEKVRTNCPITLLPFQDPWKSKNCPHSFEKAAIMNMLELSTTYLPFTQAQTSELGRIPRQDARAKRMGEIGTHQIGCPECPVKFTKADLEPNPILARKVARILEAERRQREAEDEDDEEDDDVVPRGTQRNRAIGLGSSPPRRTSLKAESVKKERAQGRPISRNQPPKSSQTAEGATVLELDSDDGEDNGEDEEMYDE